MNSYLKYIFSDVGGEVYESEWLSFMRNNTSRDIWAYLATLSPEMQLRHALIQSLAVSYFFWLYGAQAHEMMIAYSKDLKCFVDQRVALHKFDGVYNSLLRVVQDIQENWYGYDWIDVPIKSVIQFIFDTNEDYTKKKHAIPYALSKNALVPYLMHRNKMKQSDYVMFNSEVHTVRFAFTTFYCAGALHMSHSAIGTHFTSKAEDAFSADSENRNLYTSIKRSGYDYLCFLSKTILNSKNFESVLADLAQHCINRDGTRQLVPNGRLFYATSTLLNRLFSADFLDISQLNGVCPVSDPSYIYPTNVVFQFLKLLNVTQGVKVKDREMFVRFFGETSKDKTQSDVQKVVEFVKNTGTTVASAEMLSAYQRSPLGSCEAIDLISQRKPVLAQESGADETEEDPKEDESDKLDLSDLPERDDAEPGLEADDVSPEDEDTSTDEDTGKDDSSSNEGGKEDEKDNNEGSEDDNASDDAASSGDDGQGTDDAGAASDTGAANDTQTSSTPEDIDASDTLKDIPFKINPEGSETVDSVMLREELDKFLTEILTNPPKKLSPQTVVALTKLQKNWIHILSVETITGILGELIALPDKFKTIKNLHGENS